MLVLLGLFHLSRVLIELNHIRQEVEQSAVRVAPEIESAHQSKDLFSLRKTLRDIKSDGVEWLNFEGQMSKELEAGPLQIGDSQASGFLSRIFDFPVEYRGVTIGTMKFGVNPWKVSLRVFRDNVFNYLGISVFVFAVEGLVFFEIFKTILRVESDLEALAGVAGGENKTDSVEQILNGLRDHSKDQGFMALYSAHLVKVISAIKRLSEVERKSKLLEAQANIAKQVSHDIRSPLSALNMVLTTLKDLPEEKRILMRNAVQRINDIANDLLSKGKEASIQAATAVAQRGNPTQKSGAKSGAEVVLLPALVDSLVSEKRIQYRDQIDVQIESDFKDSFGAFVMADGKELMRLLSNLINNSIEAFPNSSGEVVVSVRAYKEIIQLTIKDNGSGIPPEILQKLGEAGVSHGKEGTNSGSGLGIYHAKRSVEEIGGRFNISSSVGAGTIIEINLTRVPSPTWFLASIQINPGMEILCLDDDVTIHQIWKGRLESLQVSQYDINIKNFTSATEFKNYLATNQRPNADRLYLIDYELLGQADNGLGVIEQLGLQENVALVTSRYEEPQIKRKCEFLNIKLLPKSLAVFVPIEIESPKEKIDWVLIDDDQLAHMSWQLASFEFNRSFKGFRSVGDFDAFKGNLDPKSKIFVDSDLGNGMKGEIIAESLFKDGFKNLYLATGHQPDHFPKMDFIKGIIGKEPPTDL